MPRWLRSLRQLLTGHQRRRPRPGCALRLEALEDRCVLSGGFVVTNLVADTPGVAAFTDPNLTNPWGLAASPTGPFWLSDNQAGVSTLYDGNGRIQAPLLVSIPPPGGSPAGATAGPTGTVFNSGPGFVISADGVSAPSLFLFATEDGTISGWSPAVDPNRAVLTIDNSSSGAVYKGLAVADTGSGEFLYATNFHAGTVDVFDQNFHAVRVSGSFTDPALPTGFAPFGIQNLGGELYVTYARQDAARYDDVVGPGNGFVDVFRTDGTLLRRLVSQGPLDSPWGLTLAPAGFGTFSHDLLVGNVGDGRINAFDPNSGAFLGPLTDGTGAPITVAGLWGLEFGNGTAGASTSTLFFTAGPGGQQHGLFGKLQTAAAAAGDPNAGPPVSVYDLRADPLDGPGARRQRPTPGDSYPLPPAGGLPLRADAGIQFRVDVLPALPPLSGSTPLSPQLVPATSPAEDGRVMRTDQLIAVKDSPPTAALRPGVTAAVPGAELSTVDLFFDATEQREWVEQLALARAAQPDASFNPDDLRIGQDDLPGRSALPDEEGTATAGPLRPQEEASVRVANQPTPRPAAVAPAAGALAEPGRAAAADHPWTGPLLLALLTACASLLRWPASHEQASRTA